MSIDRIPKIQENLDTLYPICDKKVPYPWIKMASDTVYSKPRTGPEGRVENVVKFEKFYSPDEACVLPDWILLAHRGYPA